MSLTDEEMVEILERIARSDKSATAQIQAIKQLRIMRGEQSESVGGFAVLDELAERRKQKEQ